MDDDRCRMLQLALSSAILGQLAILNTMVALTNETVLPEALKADVLTANRGTARLAEQVRDAIADDVPEWEREALDDD